MRWVLYLVLLLVGVGFIDAAGRQLLSGDAKFNFDTSTKSNSRVLFVYFPGILADGVMSSQELVPLWRRHGDVLLVSYDGKRFIAQKVVSAVVSDLLYRAGHHQYEKIVFLGSSMGGLLSYDTWKLLDGKLPGVKFEFVLMDAPTKRGDLQAPLDTIALGSWLWWAGPLSNLISKPYFNLTFVAPKEENIEPGVNRQKLARCVELEKSFPLSWAMDQDRYIIGHSPIMPGSLSGVSVVYVRSTRDTDTVRPEAFDTWNAATGGHADLIKVDSTHVGFNERPKTWREAFLQRIFPALGLG